MTREQWMWLQASLALMAAAAAALRREGPDVETGAKPDPSAQA